MYLFLIVSLYQEHSENASTLFLFIPRQKFDFGNDFNMFTLMIAPETEIFQGMFDTIVNFTMFSVISSVLWL